MFCLPRPAALPIHSRPSWNTCSNAGAPVLGEDFVIRILRSIDFVKEEVIRHTGPGGFGGNAPVLTFSGYDYTEYERFSQDKDWMPRLVLIAKNSYVWLDQLSKKYQSAITQSRPDPG